MQRTFLRPVILGSALGVGLFCGPWGTGAEFGGAVALAQTVPSSARPGTRSCADDRSLRSLHSREPTKITFVNKSGMYRSLNWIDFKGQSQSYGGLNSGETKTFNTFRTHPWVSATGPGDCIQIFLPSAEPGRVVLK